MNTEQFPFELIKILLTIATAVFTYLNFFREGTHKQRIEFDIDLCNMGMVEQQWILEIGCTAENKGNVEQKFDDIRVTVRGLDGSTPLKEIEGHEPRLEFPQNIQKASLIPKKYGYFFVRPKVRQRFPLVVRVPTSWTHVHIRTTFRYEGTDDIHSAERTFRLMDKDCRLE